MFQLTFSILAQLKGKLLIKCELPDDLKTETNEILGWVLPAPAAASANQDKVSFNTYFLYHMFFRSDRISSKSSLPIGLAELWESEPIGTCKNINPIHDQGCGYNYLDDRPSK